MPNQNSIDYKTSTWKTWRNRLLALAFGCVLALIVLEMMLRWLDPLAVRINGGRLSLPTNQTEIIENQSIEKVDAEISVTRNSLGFRGPDPPAQFDSRLSMIVVGGSTSECIYLSDGKTWPDQLAEKLEKNFNLLWLNNAGLDGHSTNGHLSLTKEYIVPVRPKLVLYLIGLNDVGIESDNLYDTKFQLEKRDVGESFAAQFYQLLTENYATANYFDNIRRHFKAKSMGVVHANVSHEQLKLLGKSKVEIDSARKASWLQEHSARYLPGFRSRIEQLISMAKENSIEPVLITQPALYGKGKDPQTGVDLATISVGNWNGESKWSQLEMYNEVTRTVAKENNVLLIDLAKSLSKDSAYYYDFYHFTNEGAEAVAKEVHRELLPTLKENFTAFAK